MVRDLHILIFVCNYTPVVRYDFRIGVPYLAEYEECFNSDRLEFGGSGQIIEDVLKAEEIECHGRPYSMKIKVPPMATIVFKIKS